MSRQRQKEAEHAQWCAKLKKAHATWQARQAYTIYLHPFRRSAIPFAPGCHMVYVTWQVAQQRACEEADFEARKLAAQRAVEATTNESFRAQSERAKADAAQVLGRLCV